MRFPMCLSFLRQPCSETLPLSCLVWVTSGSSCPMPGPWFPMKNPSPKKMPGNCLVVPVVLHPKCPHPINLGGFWDLSLIQTVTHSKNCFPNTTSRTDKWERSSKCNESRCPWNFSGEQKLFYESIEHNTQKYEIRDRSVQLQWI